MKLLGLTGGIGMGKSTVASLLRARGVAVVDTDDLAREVIAPGSPALEEIRREFGDAILDAAGQLRRAELAARVFADSSARRRLEAITHPRIRVLWQTEVETWRAAGQGRGVVVIPLLYETDAQGLFDAVFCVACSDATQKIRLTARGWIEAEITRRNAAQTSVTEKMRRADAVLWSEGPVEVLDAQLARLVAD
jgi:dephospho-CoA kinase